MKNRLTFTSPLKRAFEGRAVACRISNLEKISYFPPFVMSINSQFTFRRIAELRWNKSKSGLRWNFAALTSCATTEIAHTTLLMRIFLNLRLNHTIRTREGIHNIGKLDIPQSTGSRRKKIIIGGNCLEGNANEERGARNWKHVLGLLLSYTKKEREISPSAKSCAIRFRECTHMCRRRRREIASHRRKRNYVCDECAWWAVRESNDITHLETLTGIILCNINSYSFVFVHHHENESESTSHDLDLAALGKNVKIGQIFISPWQN